MPSVLKIRWVYHALIWLLAIGVICALECEDAKAAENLLEFVYFAAFIVVPMMAVVYANLAAKAAFFDTRKYGYYALSLLLILGAGTFILVRYRMSIGSGKVSLLQEFVNIAAVVPISLGLQYFKRGIVQQYQLQELKIKTVETELNALKAQINPHFLFNTLNNIYGMNQVDSENASEMILELSDVMRYHLDFSKRETVHLVDEIALLRSYVQLEKLRLNANCDLQIDFSAIDESLTVSPLIFLPFVENAFKHGTHPTRSCFIHLHFKADQSEIRFEVANSIIHNKKTIKTHVGLENTRRRLALIYGEKHLLAIINEEETHRVVLTIKP